MGGCVCAPSHVSSKYLVLFQTFPIDHGSQYHLQGGVLFYLTEFFHIEKLMKHHKIKSNALYEWIKNYDRSFDGGRLPIKNGTVSADLFCEDIPRGVCLLALKREDQRVES